MVAKVDIYGLEEIFEKNAERYISKLFPEDRADVRRFVDELLLKGYSAAKINKYLASLVSISRRLGKPFCEAEIDDIKRFAAWLQRSDYRE
jgi:transcriptional regulatory protein LevR